MSAKIFTFPGIVRFERRCGAFVKEIAFAKKSVRRQQRRTEIAVINDQLQDHLDAVEISQIEPDIREDSIWDNSGPVMWASADAEGITLHRRIV